MKNEIITFNDPKSPIAEVFKTLRTNMQFMSNKEETLTLLVTSTVPGEGKSWVTSNLAVAFAQTEKKVVIIDSDMRKGRLHNIFEIPIYPGLSNYLAETEENNEIEKFIYETEVENLSVIPAGNVPPNPSELLSSEKMVKGLEELKEKFDIILFDSTPCMLVTDAVIISRIVDYTIIVSSHKTTKIEDLKNVQKNIENVGGKIAGVVINKIPTSLKKYKSRYYYYGNREDENKNYEIKNEPKKIEKNEVKKESEIEIKQEHKKEEKEIDNKIKQEQKPENKNENAEIIDQIDKYLNNN